MVTTSMYPEQTVSDYSNAALLGERKARFQTSTKTAHMRVVDAKGGTTNTSPMTTPILTRREGNLPDGPSLRSERFRITVNQPCYSSFTTDEIGNLIVGNGQKPLLSKDQLHQRQISIDYQNGKV